jgi:putative ABC transport system ATP-binding protein
VPLIRIRGLSKVFRTTEVETHAIRGIDLDVVAGEYVAIHGPSGCGKSTLLSILGLLATPTEGKYELAGEPVHQLGAARRARVRARSIGFVFQSFNLISDLSVAENVEIPLRYQGVARKERQERTAEILERVGLAHRAHHRPAQLSGGQQQRAAVARAIVGRPRLLLADEPTGNLDSGNGEAVMDLLGKLNAGGTTLCLVTHDPRYRSCAQRSLHLLDGTLSAG